MTNQDRISIKCRNISIAAIVCVVAIHSNSLVTESNSPRWMWILCDILFRKLTCWAVPFFFAASGYWFGVKDCSTGRSFAVSRFYRKKLKALCVPYILFVLFGFGGLFIRYFLPRIKTTITGLHTIIYWRTH